MSASKHEQFNDSGTEWHPARPNEPLIERWLQGDPSVAERIKYNSKRTVYALRETADSPPRFYVKLDHPQGVRDRLKVLVRSKVKGEYTATRALYDAGVPIIEPVAAGWRGLDGLFISVALPQAMDADQLWHQVKKEPQARKAYLQGLKQLLATLLEKNLCHPDFHLGNIICTEAEGHFEFRLVDVFGVSCAASLNPTQVINLLLIVSPLRTQLSVAEREEFLRDLPKLSAGCPAEPQWRQIARANVREFYQRWPKRRRKLLRGAGAARVERTPAGRWLLLDESSAELCDRIAMAHLEVRANTPKDLLKNSRKRCVSKLEVDETSYVVKEFRRPGPWGGLASDARSWVFSWGLRHCGIRVPTCLGWLRSETGGGYLVYDYIPGRTLADLFMAGQTGPCLYQKIYDFIREMYLWRIEHEDLKLTNFVFNEDELWLVDNDAVLFDRKIGARQWERHRRHLLRGADELPDIARFADWLNTQPPPYRNL